jgi:transposase InsO family protein
VKYAFVASERTRYPIDVLCRVLDISRSGFFDYLARQAKPKIDPDAQLRADAHEIHRASRRTYGRPRLVAGLRSKGHQVGPKRVQRVMREEGLRGVVKGRFKPRTTDSKHTRKIAPNHLERRFDPDAGVPAWVGDITYIATREGWLYLAVVIALQTRQVLGYSLADTMPDDLVQAAFRNAYQAQPIDRGALFHSDRGSQYASADFTKTIESLGFVPSMSGKGDCWDNAVAESFFATLKTEEATQPYETKAAAHVGIARFIHGYYNPVRLHSTIGYLSPNDFAKTLQRQQQNRAS